jgi:type II secretory pathway pseudopilin PulG
MRRVGLTLLELLVVLVILVALAAIVVPLATDSVDDSRRIATNAQLVSVRQALLGNASSVGFYADLRRLPDPRSFVRFSYPDETTVLTGKVYEYDLSLLAQPISYQRLYDLAAAEAFIPSTQRGWRGPYLLLGETGGRRRAFQEIDDTVAETAATEVSNDGVPWPRDGWQRPLFLAVDDFIGSSWPRLSAADLRAISTSTVLPTDVTRRAPGGAENARLVSFGPNGREDGPPPGGDDIDLPLFTQP